MNWKIIQYIGIGLFVFGLTLFSSTMFWGDFKLTEEKFKEVASERQFENLNKPFAKSVYNKSFGSSYALSNEMVNIYKEVNRDLKLNQDWDHVMWDKPHSFAFNIVKSTSSGFVFENKFLMFLLTFGLGILGSLMYILPTVYTLGAPGIKNNHIYLNGVTNRGWVAYIVFGYLVLFYILLYFRPDYIVNWIQVVDPVSILVTGGTASQWFLYGFLYCVVMVVMGIRMFIKYRHNRYQVVRTATVLFFQVAFAFLIPEVLVRFNLPYMDLKNAWPLDYDMFFDWNINSMIANGTVGIVMLGWGVFLSLILVPVFVYIYGKRWYCSWVCGCGGLAETLGDPYRQHSDKSVKAWKIERWLIHAVLVFAIVMTGATLYSFFTTNDALLGIKTYDLQSWYGFLIGSIFAGVIGTGFYPVMGNRVWCRFGCPLAAYMGLVQRFKSRFRITTNGGQCISCGNCSTYCEQGIDVRWYAQRGQNIVRSSCVGCGVCSAVCPRGVLKLENGPEEGRINGERPLVLKDLINQ